MRSIYGGVKMLTAMAHPQQASCPLHYLHTQEYIPYSHLANLQSLSLPLSRFRHLSSRFELHRNNNSAMSM